MKKFLIGIYSKDNYYHTDYFEVVAKSIKQALYLLHQEVGYQFYIRKLQEYSISENDEPYSVIYI